MVLIEPIIAWAKYLKIQKQLYQLPLIPEAVDEC